MEGKSFVFAEDWQMLEPLRRRGGIRRVASDGSNLRFARSACVYVYVCEFTFNLAVYFQDCILKMHFHE